MFQFPLLLLLCSNIYNQELGYSVEKMPNCEFGKMLVVVGAARLVPVVQKNADVVMYYTKKT